MRGRVSPTVAASRRVAATLGRIGTGAAHRVWSVHVRAALQQQPHPLDRALLHRHEERGRPVLQSPHARRCRARQSHCRGVVSRGRIARPYRHGCGALYLQRSRSRHDPAAAARTRSLLPSLRYEVGSARPVATTQCGGGERFSPTVAASRRVAATLGRIGTGAAHRVWSVHVRAALQQQLRALDLVLCHSKMKWGIPVLRPPHSAAAARASVTLSRRRIAWPHGVAVSARVRRTLLAAFTFAPRSSSSCAHSISSFVTAI